MEEKKAQDKSRKVLDENVLNFKILETRRRRHMTNNVKTVLNLRSLEMPKRKFSRRRFLKKMSTVKDKSLKARNKDMQKKMN